jgi:hypothetical protein
MRFLSVVDSPGSVKLLSVRAGSRIAFENDSDQAIAQRDLDTWVPWLFAEEMVFYRFFTANRPVL